MDAFATHLRRWSDRLQHQSRTAKDVLDSQLDASAWSGLAADIFRQRLRSAASAASEAAGRHAQGAEAASRWSASLHLAQDDADRALREAEDALAELHAQEAAMAALGPEYAALVMALKVVEKAYASTEKPPPGKTAPSHSEVTAARKKEQAAADGLAQARLRAQDAQERLDAARRRAREAEEQYDADERAFARALDDALHGAATRAPKREMATFGSTVGKLSRIPVSASVNASLMDTLKTLTPDELKALMAQRPELAQQFWEHPPSADKVAGWWAGLAEDVRASWQKAAPGILGNLAGLPYSVRKTCNLAVYKEAQKHLSALSPEQRKVLAALKNVLADPSASLVCFNLNAKVPMVAVGYGDLDTADTVTWAAPGMFSDAADGTASWSLAARNLFDEQNDRDGSRTHATVAWLGYDTPDLGSVNTPALAQDGAWRFANELDGTHATRAAQSRAPLPYVSVIAHSYGTTMAADALVHTKYPIDSFTMLGSAGIDTTVVRSLSDLHVKTDGGIPAIYTTIARQDFTAPFGSVLGGRAQPNPEAVWSPGASIAGAVLPAAGLSHTLRGMGGAQSFSAEGATLLGEVLKPTQGHSAIGANIDGRNPLNGTAPAGYGYLDPYTESLRNTAYTTTGLPGKVVGGLKTNR
ncbi:alpha/beta hydrolase [Leifsonia sp. NPDC077715]|uniref:alpha/beta hydrolase n=1 Tax=Leifsonia sp. NPDC077715 TaxID=3155539 RepID=UPI00341716C6